MSRCTPLLTSRIKWPLIEVCIIAPSTFCPVPWAQPRLLHISSQPSPIISHPTGIERMAGSLNATPNMPFHAGKRRPVTKWEQTCCRVRASWWYWSIAGAAAEAACPLAARYAMPPVRTVHLPLSLEGARFL